MSNKKIPRKTLLTIVSRSKAMRIPRKRISQLVDFVAAAEKVEFDEVDIAVVASREMSRMNRKFLNHSGATDVISFDLGEPGENLTAELIVCSDVAVREAKKYAHTAQRELLLYVTHGLLHVIGYDDTTPAKAKKMHARQEQLLENFLKKASSTRG
ncbi:MAG: rRNA maturation RNase YbeY [Phycisphaerae bacterium]|nr:rRNA maturation RNase YbeY [Phycisphaerae bacterium]